MEARGHSETGENATGKSTLGFTLPFVDKAPANPAEFMTAMTMASMAIGAQVANAFFGMMQVALENTPKQQGHAASTGEAQPDGVAPEPVMTAPAAKVERPVELAEAKVKRARPVAAKKAVAGRGGASSAAGSKSAVKARKGSVPAKDDLKRISGIGPKLEGLLNSMGVLRIEQIAGWSEENVEHFDRELGLDGRIAKDGWIAQAKSLLR
ncbi:5' DNA nuclease [Rhizobium helianthi]|uniref:5' DNA nuclease n=1 Tax=Rhizobium helianthi TaxID=1132695 RepID=A0ABW4LY94_9HYPH